MAKQMREWTEQEHRDANVHWRLTPEGKCVVEFDPKRKLRVSNSKKSILVATTGLPQSFGPEIPGMFFSLTAYYIPPKEKPKPDPMAPLEDGTPLAEVEIKIVPRKEAAGPNVNPTDKPEF